jgi:CBS domain containing-hemolysin-like protein
VTAAGGIREAVRVPGCGRDRDAEEKSMHLSGEMVDTVADYLAIFVLFFVPALLIYVFWMIHILPEKIAERRGHPQADAIKTLCLLSLVFGGLLWPIAWLWAYSKPVFYKTAYGTDVVDHHGAEPARLAEAAKAEEQHGTEPPRVAESAQAGEPAAAVPSRDLAPTGTFPRER